MRRAIERRWHPVRLRTRFLVLMCTLALLAAAFPLVALADGPGPGPH
jgi:hypothetical protein